jgi:hypothetical protein
MMQERKCAAALIAAAVGVFGFAAAARASAPVVFGSFEGSQPDGFAWFNNNGFTFDPFATYPSATYSYSTVGATDGTTSLAITDDPGSGFLGNDIAYDFVANGHVGDFLANDILSFDFSFPTSTTPSGFAQVYSVALNGQNAGFANQGTSPLVNQSPPYNGQIDHVSINYDAFKAGLPSNPSYLQMIISTNSGGGAPSTIYVDNFALSSVPEPASLGVLGAAGIGLLGRRRRR